MANGSVSDDEKRVFIQTRESRRCKQMFYLYTGNAQALMMDPLAFLVKTNLLKRNLVMYRDLSKRMFLWRSGSANRCSTASTLASLTKEFSFLDQ